MKHLPLALCCLLAATLQACQGTPTPTAKVRPATGASLPSNTSQVVAGSALSGQVVAPAGIVAGGAGNIVAGGAGNIVAGGAGNYRLAQAEAPASGAIGAEGPLVGATVFLADANGDPIPGVVQVKTDGAGKFQLRGVDPQLGETYQVIVVASASGSEVRLRSLGSLNESATISLATTHALISLTDRLGKVKGKGLKRAKLEKFVSLAEGFQKRLKEEGPALNRPQDWGQWNANQLAKHPELASALAEAQETISQALQEASDRLKEGLQEGQARLDEAADTIASATGGLPIALPNLGRR